MTARANRIRRRRIALRRRRRWGGIGVRPLLIADPMALKGRPARDLRAIARAQRRYVRAFRWSCRNVPGFRDEALRGAIHLVNSADAPRAPITGALVGTIQEGTYDS